MVVKRDEIGRGDDLDRFDRRHAIVVRHDPDEPASISVRQRTEQHRVDHAEHGGRQTDAEGEGRDDERGEAWASANEPQRVAGVLQRVGLPRSGPRPLACPLWFV